MIQPLGTNYHRWMRWWWPEAFLRWCNIILPYYSSGAEISWNGSNKETSRKLECGGFGKKDAWWCSFFFEVCLLLEDWIAFCSSHVLLPTPVLTLLLQSKLGASQPFSAFHFDSIVHFCHLQRSMRNYSQHSGNLMSRLCDSWVEPRHPVSLQGRALCSGLLDWLINNTAIALRIIIAHLSRPEQ